MVVINVNDRIRIKLTPLGKKVYTDHHMDIGMIVHAPDVLEIPIWEMALIFGRHMHMGGEVPFETEFELIW